MPAVDARRLGRLPQFDDRSRAYPIRPLTSGALARRTWALRDRLDQGVTPRCVGFSAAHHVAAAPVEQRAGAADLAARVYARAQQIDEWPGVDYDGTSVLAGVKTLAELGHVAEYRWSFSIADLAAAVSSVGPAILGLPWHASMFDLDADGYVRPDGDVVGGHAILCRGVDPARRRFTLTNSWGRAWGRNGDAYVDFDDLAALLADDGEACVPVARLARP